MKRWIPVFTVGIAISVLTAHAHHSISGVYDSSRQVTIEGIIAQFQFVNPHPFVTMDVPHSSGSTQQWRLEMDNRSELARIGMTSETLKQCSCPATCSDDSSSDNGPPLCRSRPLRPLFPPLFPRPPVRPG